MFKLLWAWATVFFSTHPECLKAPFTSIWSFETFTSSEYSQLMLQQLRQLYTKSCNYKIANNLDHVQTSRCVHIHHVQTRPTLSNSHPPSIMIRELHNREEEEMSSTSSSRFSSDKSNGGFSNSNGKSNGDKFSNSNGGQKLTPRPSPRLTPRPSPSLGSQSFYESKLVL